MRIQDTEREQNRTDFPQEFLDDLCNQTEHARDPRNYIGLNFGFNFPRALEIAYRRVLQNA